MGHLAMHPWGTLNMDLESRSLGGAWLYLKVALATLFLLEVPVLWELLSTSLFFPAVKS